MAGSRYGGAFVGYWNLATVFPMDGEVFGAVGQSLPGCNRLLVGCDAFLGPPTW